MPDNDLELLSVKIEKWRPLARRLRFEEGEIVKFHSLHDDVSEKAFAMLLAWKQRDGAAATYRVLHDALCHPLVNRKDLAYTFCFDASSSLVST